MLTWFLMSFFLNSGSAFQVLEGIIPVFPKVIEPCQGISQNLLKATKDVAEQLTNSGYPVVVGGRHSTGSICNERRWNGYGYTVLHESFTEIQVSERLLNSPHTLHNVVLHEVLHSLGLHHSEEEGMMKYAVSENWWGGVVEDQRKLWLSLDDLQGLYHLRELFN